ncbi:MAG: ribonuclease J [Candidatus Campbellbacteria bacterium]|nr:ribonuclease J [Candidatus Campbellbacteria bacterium]
MHSTTTVGASAPQQRVSTAQKQNPAQPRQRRVYSPLMNTAHPQHPQRSGVAFTSSTQKKSPSPHKRRESGHGGGHRGRKPMQTRINRQPENTEKKGPVIPPPALGVLRVIPLGGTEEIGKNMTVLEYGDEIIVVDAGFQFSEAETPGIDFILPDVTYLKERQEKVKALFITHGHYDHIGAIPYLIEEMGNPPIYSREFGSLIIQKRQVEFPDVPPLTIRTVRGTETIKIGNNFSVSFFPISHTIPDAMGLLIDTPVGTVAFVEDVRVDHVDGVPTEKEKEHWKAFKDKNIVLFTLDSTSVEKPGFSLPESHAIQTTDQIMKEVAGRLIIGTFASNVERIIQFIQIAHKYNKMIAVDGRSMKSNVEIVKQLQLVKFDNVIPIEEIDNYPANKIVILATGAQGEEYSVFDRIANKTHKYITLSRADTVVFSSSVIPGNENSITKLKDNLYRQEARIITYQDSAVHASGHGNRDELGWIHQQIKYKFFIPLHGHHYMLRIHAELAESLGTPRENIVIPDNGSIIEISENGTKIDVRKEKAPSGAIMVDGFSVGEHQKVVIRDRQTLAEDGIFVIVVSVNPRTGKLRKSPDIISRGFVYLKEQQELISGARTLVTKTVEKTTHGMQPINFDIVKTVLTDDVRRFLFQKTGKSPIVIPVVIGV